MEAYCGGQDGAWTRRRSQANWSVLTREMVRANSAPFALGGRQSLSTSINTATVKNH